MTFVDICSFNYLCTQVLSFPNYIHKTSVLCLTDQMTFVLRNVKVEESEAQIKESFRNFFPQHGKTA